MSRLIPLTATALTLMLVMPHAAAAEDPGKGDDRGRGEARGGGAERERGNGRGDDRGKGDDRARGEPRDDRADKERGNGRGDDRRAGRPETQRPDTVRGDDDDRRDDRREARRADGRQVFQTRDGRPVVYFQRERDRGLIAGCPPGLAKKNNGCLPPGLARKAAPAVGAGRYDWLWRTRGDDSRYRFDNGYLYRMNQQGSVLGYLPVLGGALAPGATWPSQYAYQPAPDYYARYYGLPRGQDYRYADGALYGVDPQTQRIRQVAALLTGQNLSVGQPLPSGYDVYNVPYAQRAQYADNANAMYRYNDGYVYQADPKTRLVTSVIQLLS